MSNFTTWIISNLDFIKETLIWVYREKWIRIWSLIHYMCSCVRDPDFALHHEWRGLVRALAPDYSPNHHIVDKTRVEKESLFARMQATVCISFSEDHTLRFWHQSAFNAAPCWNFLRADLCFIRGKDAGWVRCLNCDLERTCKLYLNYFLTCPGVTETNRVSGSVWAQLQPREPCMSRQHSRIIYILYSIWLFLRLKNTSEYTCETTIIKFSSVVFVHMWDLQKLRHHGRLHHQPLLKSET